MQRPTASRPDAQLFGLLKVHGHCDLLIDRVLSHPLAALVAAEAFEEPPVALNPKAISLDEAMCPLLLRLRMDNLALLEASISLAQRQWENAFAHGRPVCAWLFGASGTLHRHAAHIERQIIVRDPVLGRVALRFYDPRVMSRLRHILDASQLNQLLGPCHTWAWLDRQGLLQQQCQSESRAAGRSALTALTLSVEQSSALGRIEVLNQTVAALDQLGTPWPVHEDEQIDRWLLEAVNKGHAERTDQVTYALHAAMVGPDFDSHPKVQTAIAAACSQGLSLNAALDGFDDAFWAELRASSGAPTRR